jgi:transposase-like protein
MVAGLGKPMELVVIVITLLSYGCPIQAIVQAFELDERTVASWPDRAGKHGEQVHRQLIEQGRLDLTHVQADEMRLKARGGMVWMGLAMMVSTRLWLAGAVSTSRESRLADALFQPVRRCCQRLCPLFICTAGWNASPKRILRAFGEKVKRTPGKGRAA